MYSRIIYYKLKIKIKVRRVFGFYFLYLQVSKNVPKIYFFVIIIYNTKFIKTQTPFCIKMPKFYIEILYKYIKMTTIKIKLL